MNNQQHGYAKRTNNGYHPTSFTIIVEFPKFNVEKILNTSPSACLGSPEIRRALRDEFNITHIEDYNFYADGSHVSLYRPFRDYGIENTNVHVIIEEKD